MQKKLLTSYSVDNVYTCIGKAVHVFEDQRPHSEDLNFYSGLELILVNPSATARKGWISPKLFYFVCGLWFNER